MLWRGAVADIEVGNSNPATLPSRFSCDVDHPSSSSDESGSGASGFGKDRLRRRKGGEAILDFATDRVGVQYFLHLTRGIPPQAALGKT